MEIELGGKVLHRFWPEIQESAPLSSWHGLQCTLKKKTSENLKRAWAHNVIPICRGLHNLAYDDVKLCEPSNGDWIWYYDLCV